MTAILSAQALRQRHGRLPPRLWGIYGLVSFGAHLLLLGALRWTGQVEWSGQAGAAGEGLAGGQPLAIEFVELAGSAEDLFNQLPADGGNLTAAELNQILAAGQAVGSEAEPAENLGGQGGQGVLAQGQGEVEAQGTVPEGDGGAEAAVANPDGGNASSNSAPAQPSLAQRLNQANPFSRNEPAKPAPANTGASRPAPRESKASQPNSSAPSANNNTSSNSNSSGNANSSNNTAAPSNSNASQPPVKAGASTQASTVAAGNTGGGTNGGGGTVANDKPSDSQTEGNENGVKRRN
ncbi:MAG: hypothetical protein HC824_05605 [Synechococcales cyanobacterium RM1_1_8]|nr:hypothetical protein [Synechococcales cyanobacterium RM1_1_8]